MKTFLLSLLTILLPMVAFADAVEIDGIYYNIISKNKGAEVTSNPNKYSGSVDIPASITFDGVEYSVTSIGGSAFQRCYSLTSVTIPSSVTSIGASAFEYCNSLTTVTIPNRVTSIGGYAFGGCISLSSVTIPDSVTKIGAYAFSGCSSLTSVTIPGGVTSIGGHAFSSCSSLSSITIPNSVTSIGESAFGWCFSLTSVNISDIAAWCSITFSTYESNPLTYGGKLYLNGQLIEDLIIPNTVISIGMAAFHGCSSLTTVTIPNTVTSIGDLAFGGCSNLISVTIPNSVTLIGGSAFGGCSSLTSVTIPNSVTSIGWEVFCGCSSLTTVTIPNSVTTIGGYAFSSCPELIDVFCLAEKVPYTSSDAFQGSYIEYATLHVPAVSVDAYRAAVPWKNFKNIVVWEGQSIETIDYTSPSDRIDVYSFDGKLIGSAADQSEAASIINNLPSGTAAIVRIGGKSVKVVVK